MNKFWLSLIFFLCLLLVACSNQESANPKKEIKQEPHRAEADIKIVASEKNLPSNFRGIAVERKEVPNYLYLVNRVDQQTQYEEIWSMFNLEQQIPIVNFEENDIYFIGVQESGSCPYELENIKMSINEEVMNIHLSGPDGPCTLDATARTFVIEVNKESSNNLKNVVINQSDVETTIPIIDGK